jgi:signal transduction histidine kinase
MDKKLLRRCMSNLLSNAIKYSPPDSLIQVELLSDGDEMTFRVKDSGIGIPEQDQQFLFEAFHRASNVGHVPGTGLGLVIVRQSVEAQGGTIACESEVGIGTTFTVTLPLQVGDP